MPLNILQGADEILIDLETQAHPDPAALGSLEKGSTIN